MSDYNARSGGARRRPARSSDRPTRSGEGRGDGYREGRRRDGDNPRGGRRFESRNDREDRPVDRDGSRRARHARGDRETSGSREDRRGGSYRGDWRRNERGESGYRGEGRREERRDGGYRSEGRRADRPREDREGSSGGGRWREERNERRSGAERGGRSDRPTRSRRPDQRDEQRDQDARDRKAHLNHSQSRRKSKTPDLPEDINVRDLDASVRQELRSLDKVNAERVGAHLVMAALVMDDDPELALEHARAARERAGRVSVVRETVGTAAYRVGDYKEALAELRAARRIGGGPGLLAVMADCERALGNTDKAISLLDSEDASRLEDVDHAELAIVVASIRAEQGQGDLALAILESEGLDLAREDVTGMRLMYVYADILDQLNRKDEARTYFSRAAEIDEYGMTDAAARAAAL